MGVTRETGGREHLLVHRPPAREVSQVVDDEELSGTEALSRVDLGAVINRVDDGFFAVDRDWHIRFANAAAARLVRREAHELLGKYIWDEFPTAAGSVFDLQYRQAVETQQSVEFEAYFDGLDAWFNVRVYPSADGLTLIFRNVSHLRALRAERRANLVRLLGSEDVERARIAAGVHDDSVQALAVVSLQLQILRRRLPAQSADVDELLDDLGETVVTATKRLRALLFSLEPTDTNTPVADSIRTQAAHIFYDSQVHWSVDDVDAGEELPHAERGQALRITKEALSNARAHSEASEVIVTLRGDDAGLEVLIADNGRTEDPGGFASAPGHRGLETMRDRAAAVDGWCRMEPSSPHGCTVRFYIPRAPTGLVASPEEPLPDPPSAPLVGAST
jgi:signal transduction histidine kinase